MGSGGEGAKKRFANCTALQHWDNPNTFKGLVGKVQKKLFANCKFTALNNPNTFTGLMGEVQKNYLQKEERKGDVGEKSVRSTPAWPGARTQDLPRARWGPQLHAMRVV